MLPDGFLYVADAITIDAERTLIAWCATLPFAAVRMRGYVGKRRTVHFGVEYGFDSRRGNDAPPIPGVLLPLRDRAGELAAIDPASFTEALVTEYAAGAAIGWHRDAPMFGAAVVGFSLASPCRMRFRRGVDPRAAVVERASIVLEPRSAYLLAGAARSEWQHSIPGVDALRYSITFRTLRRRVSGT
jgi:alkylated DNA repair dioxygenase AlkB